MVRYVYFLTVVYLLTSLFIISNQSSEWCAYYLIIISYQH
jgi:hypothetical protein